MDNRTLLMALDIVLLNCAVFAFVLGGRLKTRNWAWQVTSLLNLTGFLLLSLQLYLPLWLTVVLANLLILAGNFTQVVAALQLHDCAERMPRLFFPLLFAAYTGLQIYFTYFVFNTAVRIIVISSGLVLISGFGAILLMRQFRRQQRRFVFHGIELMLLFVVTAVFFIFRICITIISDLTIVSLIDPDRYTSISFIFTLFQNLIFFMAMASASLRKKNKLLETEKRRFQYLFSFLNDTAGHLDIEKLYQRIGEILTQTLNIDSGGIFLLDEERKGLTLSCPINYLDIDTSSVQYLERGNELIWKAIEGDAVVTIDVRDYPDTPFLEQMKKKGIQYLAAAPIKTDNGVIGGMTVLFTSRENFLMLDRNLFYYLGEQIGLVLHNALMYGKISTMAHTDPLTGLYTRRKFYEILSAETRRSLRYSKSFCIAMADLDHFKAVNDSAGHDCGDRLLKMASAVFQRECRDTDYICRWGGEEFIFLFLNTDLDMAFLISERIRSAVEEETCRCAGSVKTTISIGLVQSNADLSIEELIKKADELLYKAKMTGRNRVVTG